jgi:hypothetical protein
MAATFIYSSITALAKAVDFIRALIIIFAFFLAENSETQSRKYKRLKARNKTTFRPVGG